MHIFGLCEIMMIVNVHNRKWLSAIMRLKASLSERSYRAVTGYVVSACMSEEVIMTPLQMDLADRRRSLDVPMSRAGRIYLRSFKHFSAEPTRRERRTEGGAEGGT